MKIKVKKIEPDASLPKYSRSGDVAADLYSYESAELLPGCGRSFRTGIAVEVPEGYALLIWDRSGLAFKQGLTTLGGVVDSNFRGEIGIYLHNTSDKSYKIEKGDRIAQFLIQKVELPEIEEVEQLSFSERGDNWQGSSGR